MKELKDCPVCGSTNHSHFMDCKDYTVSGETFKIVSCGSCNFKFTNPRPEDSQMGAYYKSEDYISHSNTKKGLIYKLYHVIRNYTLAKKLNLVSSHVSRGTILDYGCGTGMFLTQCKGSGWDTYGLEPDSDARGMAEAAGIKAFANKTDLLVELKGKRLTAITLWHVLEHVTDLKETLNFFSEQLAPDGVLIIAVPNYTSFDASYYKQFWAAYDVPRHIYHFEINTISRLMSNYGFRLKETNPMKFDSFYVSMLSEKYKTGSINYFNAFLSGLRSNMRAKSAKDYSSVIYVFKKA